MTHRHPRLDPPPSGTAAPPFLFNSLPPQFLQLGPGGATVSDASKKPKPRPRRPPQEPRGKILPAALSGPGPDSNETYEHALVDPRLEFHPQSAGFVPSNYWLNTPVTFGELCAKFFRRKNNSSCRFPHKLYNALILVSKNPAIFPVVGVRWVTETVFLVDKFVFGRLLGISAFDGGLFHRQGNFPSHGFVEIPVEGAAGFALRNLGEEFDGDRFRLLRHKSGEFKQGCSQEFFNTCKWAIA
jgi:hypothetical protein